jgi:hypothetical protein
MSTIIIDSKASDEQRRKQLYDGAIFFFTPRPSVAALRDHAWELIGEAFDPVDPKDAQEQLDVEKFVELAAPLKTKFTHSPRAKELLRDLLVDFGCDPETTYFDLPKLRIVTHSGYLTAGVGYAYQAHRDIWYAAPMCQQNWWFPLVDIGDTSALAFHPQYWNTPVPNTSAGFDPYKWNATARKDAAKYIKSDDRPHPTTSDPVPENPQIRVVGGSSSMLLFSAAHLHSTVPNTSGRTRFSIDFRTASLLDLEARGGAANVDNESTGTTLRDYLRASDFTPVPDELISEYDQGSTHEGVLVFDPSAAG